MIATHDEPTRCDAPAGLPAPDDPPRPRAADRDMSALISELHPSLLAFARTMVADPHTAEDLVQDTWIAVLQGHEKFEGRSSFRTWAFGILRKRILKSHASEVRRREQLSLGDDERRRLMDEQLHPAGHPLAGHWDIAPSNRFLPEDRVVSAEIRATVLTALAELPPRQRQVVQLRDVEDMSAEEVCELLDMTPGALSALLYRSRLKLRSILAERHFPDAKHHH